MNCWRMFCVMFSALCILVGSLAPSDCLAVVIERDDLGSDPNVGNGSGVLDPELYGGSRTWLAYNGTGAPGRGNGQTGFSSEVVSDPNGSFTGTARGIYIYPFESPDPNNFPENHVPLLANVKPLEVADQFELGDYSDIEFSWENIEFFGLFSALHWVLNVDGTWYFHNDLTFSADSVSGDSDGDDAARLAFNPSASAWTELLLGPTAYYRNKASEDPDFDDDGLTTGLDFLAWQRGFGSSGPSNNADGNANQSIAPVGSRDDQVNLLDLAIWEDHYLDPFDPNNDETPSDIDTIAVGSAAGADLTGTVQGYGFFLQASELSTSPPFVQGTDILNVQIEGTPVVPLSGLALVPEPTSALLMLAGLVCLGRAGSVRQHSGRRD